jgi:nucleotide-binding universal stress UspA family protein
LLKIKLAPQGSSGMLLLSCLRPLRILLWRCIPGQKRFFSLLLGSSLNTPKTYSHTVCFESNMKHILIPTDFSENAGNALTYGLELARMSNAKCTLLHAYEMPHDFVSQMENRIVAIRENAEKELDKILHQLKQDERYSSLSIDWQLKEGGPESIVTNLAEQIGADLIVIGLTQHSRLENFTGENTGAKVVQRSLMPVLAIPENVAFSRPKEILYAAEYRDEDIENLQVLSDWARIFDAELRVIHISEKEVKDEKQRFKGFERALEEHLTYPYVNHELYAADEVEEGILKLVGNREGVILSMAHYHKSFLKEVFGSSHTKEIALKTRVPLLVYYEKEE